jgi:hypothetical protein
MIAIHLKGPAAMLSNSECTQNCPAQQNIIGLIDLNHKYSPQKVRLSSRHEVTHS